MPGKACALCKTTCNNTLSTFAPPTDDSLRSKWETVCGVKLSQHSRICSKHFYAKDFVLADTKSTTLHPEAVPSLNLPSTSVQKKETDDSPSKYTKNRATMEQLLFFVNYARNHPKILTSKFEEVSDLWKTLAQQLNSVDGAYRSAKKWKENMCTWRCQLRCRARRGRSSGVPEFDEFALCSFGRQTLANNDEEELTEQEDTDDEDASQPLKKFKETSGNEDETEITMEPEVKIEINTEIDDENTTNMSEACAITTEQHSEREVTLDFEEELYIKTDIEFEGDENAINLENTSTELVDLPRLGFTQTSRSEIFDISRSTTTANTSTKLTGATNNGRKLISRASNAHVSKKASEEATLKRRAVIPCPKDVLEKATNKHTDTAHISPPSTSMTNTLKGLDETSKQKKIVPTVAGNRVQVIQLDNGLLKLIRAPSPKSTLNTERVNITGTFSQTTALDTSMKVSEVIEAESYNTEDSLQSASSSPTPRVAEHSPKVSRKRKPTCLNEMYETVLTSMKKRDKREEQILSVLQGLTIAVTRLADNVKMLEEALIYGSND